MPGVLVGLHGAARVEPVAHHPHAVGQVDLEQLQEPGVAEIDEGQLGLAAVQGGGGFGDRHGPPGVRSPRRYSARRYAPPTMTTVETDAPPSGLRTRLVGSTKEAWGDFSRRRPRRSPAPCARPCATRASMVDGAAVTPIAVLFGHTFLDAFDRGGFNIILPEVQKAFDLDLAGITGLASVSIVAGIVLSLPVSLWSDRSGRRTLFLALGAFVAAFFSLTAGIAATIGLFGASAGRVRLRADRERPGAAEPASPTTRR